MTGTSLKLTLVWGSVLPPPLIQNPSSVADLNAPLSKGPSEGVLGLPYRGPLSVGLAPFLLLGPKVCGEGKRCRKKEREVALWEMLG